MYYLSRASVRVHHQRCAPQCIWIGRREAKEAVLEFRDNPCVWLSAHSKSGFLLVRHTALPHKEQTLSVDGTNLLCVVDDKANKAVEGESDRGEKGRLIFTLHQRGEYN